MPSRRTAPLGPFCYPVQHLPQALQQSLIEEGYEVILGTGDVGDPIPGILEIKDSHGNRVDLLLGLLLIGACSVRAVEHNPRLFASLRPSRPLVTGTVAV